jgi:GT2 family glycosyltransferase
MTPRVAAVVLSWNGKEDTLACLRSLGAATYPELDVLVVDNHSSDGSAEAVAAQHPEASLVRLDANLGFAGGMNAGIAAARSDGASHVMLLNNDTVVEPGFLEPLVAALAADDAVALFASDDTC